jgi:hypothetical protein
LFYLRGIADTLFKNKSLPRKVESRDIYLGAIPWIVIQLILVAVVIFFPQTVTMFLDKEQVLDLDKAGQMIEQMDSGKTGSSTAEPDGSLGLPPVDAASGPGGQGASAPAEAGDKGKEDPMKGLIDSLEKDKGSKP